MSLNDRAPRDRATAQLVIVFGGALIAIGIIIFVVAMVVGALDETTRRGLPVWLAAPFVVAFGAWILWRGIKMHREDKSPPVNDSSRGPSARSCV